MAQFDFIVVGAGSSGCVVANRLSEDPDVSVLLIEAGGSADRFWVHAPAGMGRLFLEKSVNWAYFTQQIPAARNRSIYWPRGRMLGGTSAVNGMVYVRGHPADFDGWEKQGATGWSWASVLPYFLKSESNTRGSSEYHSADGPMQVSDPVLRSAIIEDYIAAAESAGIPRTSDHNAPPYEGADFHQHTIRNGRRESAYTAFIEPIRKRRNLKVMSGARVTRLTHRGTKITGVEIIRDGKTSTAEARCETILSAGSLNSPHILMISGIGPGRMLANHGLAVIANLEGVGRNLQDHWFAPMIWRTTPESSLNRDVSGLRKYWNGARYLLAHSGVLAISASQSAAFVRSSPAAERPDLQLVLRPTSYTFDPKGAVVVDAFPGVSAGLVLLNPASRGWIELASPDPLEAPAFHPNYLADTGDVDRTVAGLRRMREIMTREPIASRIVAEVSPGPEVVSDEAIAEHLRTIGNCGWHQVGTCRMGQDELAVVDPRLRVRGVTGLRVIDGSVMPSITSGNTNAPCIMIGEKGADMILEDWSHRA